MMPYRLVKPTTKKGTNQNMQHVTLEQMCDLLKHMIITQSIDSGFAIAHTGHIDGVPTIAISTCRGTGECYIIQ